MMRSAKQLSLRATNSATFSGFLSLLERADRYRDNLLAILTYHRVDDPERTPHLYPGLVSASPMSFAKQMTYLARHYHVVSMEDLLEARRTGHSLPPRSMMITFDDAYCDFAEHAWPVLKKLGLPVTLFVPTGFPDQPERVFWWDRLHHALLFAPRGDILDTPCGRFSLKHQADRYQAFLQLKEQVKTMFHAEALALVDDICTRLDAPPPQHHVLGWDDLRSLARQGVALGAHTQTHPLLNRISSAEAEQEIVHSLQDLQREISSVLPIFSYPGGALSDDVVDTLQRHKIALAFTTARGMNDLRNVDPLRLRRINIGKRTSENVLRAQLLAWSIYLRPPGFLTGTTRLNSRGN